MYKRPVFALNLIAILTFLPLSAFAQSTTGEIINVSYDYKIAFTDLSQNQLNIGDVVEVFNGRQFTTYLQVLETSSVVSKLGSVESNISSDFHTDFDKISIGNTVIKRSDIPSQKQAADQVQKSIQTSPASAPASNKTAQELQDALERVDDLNKLNRELEEKIKRSDAQLNSVNLEKQKYDREVQRLKNKVDQLRLSLENMESIINKSTAAYDKN